MTQEVAQQVRHVVADQLNVDVEKVVGAARFREDLGADSLDTVELVMALEESFSIVISDADAERIDTVDAAVSYIVSARSL